MNDWPNDRRRTAETGAAERHLRTPQVLHDLSMVFGSQDLAREFMRRHAPGSAQAAADARRDTDGVPVRR
jgi:hypothetical protein